MLRLSLITQATTEPITVALACAHCRVDFADEDELMAIYVSAARDRCEKFTGRSIIARTYTLKLDQFSQLGTLPNGPVTAVASIAYTDETGTAQTVGAPVYRVDGDTIALNLDQSWPGTNGDQITVTYTTGYADGACPSAIKAAILLYVGDLFGVRESQIVGTMSKNESAEALLWPYMLNPLGLALVTE